MVPRSCAAKVSEDGVSVTPGDDVGGGGEDAVQPDSLADAELEPSLTVIWHVDELYGSF